MPLRALWWFCFWLLQPPSFFHGTLCSCPLLISSLCTARDCRWKGALLNILSLDFPQHFIIILSLPFYHQWELRLSQELVFVEQGDTRSGHAQDWPSAGSWVSGYPNYRVQKGRETKTWLTPVSVFKGIKFNWTSGLFIWSSKILWYWQTRQSFST